jgi:hypothetical protein
MIVEKGVDVDVVEDASEASEWRKIACEGDLLRKLDELAKYRPASALSLCGFVASLCKVLSINRI